MDSEFAAQLADLTRRVEALEGTAPVTPATPVDDPLWILNGIKKLMPADTAGAIVFAGAVSVAAGPVEWQVGFPVDGLLEDDWSTRAASIGSLGHPVRLALLHAVINGATTVGQLSEGLGTTGQLYHHLNQLVAQGWLQSAGRGHYSIPAERVVPLLVILSAARRTS